MGKKILFVGAEAIGSYLGAFLTRAGHDVTLIDAWADQVGAIRQKGISVTGPHDPFEAQPTAVRLHEAARLPRDFEIASSEVGRAITIHLGAESARVGLALGYRIPKFGSVTAEQWADAGRRETYEALDRMLTPTSTGSRSWRASMAQDVTKGRPTEIDYMNGHVVAQGRERGVPTPVSAAVVAVVHEVERGQRKPEPQNIALTLRRAGV